MQLNFYADPGHGWLQCSRLVARELGFIDKISSFSYQHGDELFLEEDCDAALYINALKARGVEFEFKDFDSNTDSRIRSYARFRLFASDLRAIA